MHINGIYYYKGRLVMITDGQYYGSYGRISNHWSFRYFKEDGTLGKKTGNDYDNGLNKFIPVDANVKIKVEIPAETMIRMIARQEYEKAKNCGKRAMYVCKTCGDPFVRGPSETINMLYDRLREHGTKIHPGGPYSVMTMYTIRKINKAVQKQFPIHTNGGDFVDI